MAKQSKPMEGHKLAGYSYGVETRCECGWRSVTFYGKGARSQALHEWYTHKDQCAKEQGNGHG